MDLALSEDQRSVKEVFADFFSTESPIERVRDSEELGFDLKLWTLAADIGIPSMGISSDLGGGDATLLDLALVCIEAGRTLAPLCLPDTLVAGLVLSRTAAGSSLVPQIISGEVIPTISPRPAVDGVAALAPAGAVAHVLVALDGDELISVVRTGESPFAPPVKNLGSAPIADWRVDGSDGQRTVLARGVEAQALFEQALLEWKTLTAAALYGLQARALEIGLAYVKERRLFGTTLATFQAIQHRLADISVAGVGAELLVLEAAWAEQVEPERFAALADMAFLFTSDLAVRTARESLQFHGGYGYTLEYDIQMYFRRAKAWPLAIGARQDQFLSLAAALFDVPTAEV